MSLIIASLCEGGRTSSYQLWHFTSILGWPAALQTDLSFLEIFTSLSYSIKKVGTLALLHFFKGRKSIKL